MSSDLWHRSWRRCSHEQLCATSQNQGLSTPKFADHNHKSTHSILQLFASYASIYTMLNGNSAPNKMHSLPPDLQTHSRHLAAHPCLRTPCPPPPSSEAENIRSTRNTHQLGLQSQRHLQRSNMSLSCLSIFNLCIGTGKGVITKGVFSLEESIESQSTFSRV